MHAYFERQMNNKVDSAPEVATGGAIESLSTATDSYTSSQSTETIITEEQLVPKFDPASAPALTVVG